jgi:hypothetical protein
MEGIYAAGLDTPVPFDTEARYEVVVPTEETYIDPETNEEKTRTVERKYIGRWASRPETKNGFIGLYTACCQHLMKAAGTPCAISTMIDPFSQLFVIENEKGTPVAQSWGWVNNEGEYRKVCFDNVEALKAYANKPFINKIYEMAAKDLAQTNNVQLVTIGVGGRGVDADADLSKYDAAEEPISLPKAYGHQYSDSHEQVVLVKNENATPLDHSQDNDCFVRSVCAADLEQMKAISAECFEGEDKRLAISGDDTLPTGKVLVNRLGKVVGYLLYDEAEHRVDDLAVLPKYRKDKNASSRKLLASVMKDLKHIGGEWEAELRDNTSQRLLKALAAGGHITLSEGVFDRNMTNEKGEVVASFYRHKFKFLDKPAPQKANETEAAKKVESEKTEAKEITLQPKAKDSKANQFMKMLTRLRGPRQAG